MFDNHILDFCEHAYILHFVPKTLFNHSINVHFT